MTALDLWILPNQGLDTAVSVEANLKEFRRRHPKTEVRVTVMTSSSLWDHLFHLLKRPDQFGAVREYTREGTRAVPPGTEKDVAGRYAHGAAGKERAFSRGAGGEPRPDVIQIPSYWTSTLAQWGLLEDLSELEPLTAAVFEPLRAHCRAGSGKCFSVPWWMEVAVCFYRKDLFRKCGVTEDSISNWRGLEEAFRTLARSRFGKDGGYPLANPNPREGVSLPNVAPLVWGRGGDFMSQDGGRSLLHRRETIEGIAAYFRLIQERWMPMLAKSGGVSGHLFDGRCAVQFSGRYPRGKSNRGKTVGILPQAGGMAPLLSAYHLAVARGTDHFVQATELVRYFTAAPASSRYADAIGALSCLPGSSPAPKKTFPDAGRAFGEALAAARLIPNQTLMPTLGRIFGRAADKLVKALLTQEYDEELMKAEILRTAAEMDYVLETTRAGNHSKQDAERNAISIS